mgnify:CR=1 FL=1
MAQLLIITSVMCAARVDGSYARETASMKRTSSNVYIIKHHANVCTTMLCKIDLLNCWNLIWRSCSTMKVTGQVCILSWIVLKYLEMSIVLNRLYMSWTVYFLKYFICLDLSWIVLYRLVFNCLSMSWFVYWFICKQISQLSIPQMFILGPIMVKWKR